MSELYSYISASRLNLWIKCPLAFRFRYIDGLATPPNENLFLGKVVHSALERYYRNRQIGLIPEISASTRFVEDSWNETEPMEWCCREDEAKCKNQAVDLVRKYMEEFSGRPERIVAMESTLEVYCEDFEIPFYGVVDLVLQENERPVVVDFKTASSASPLCEQSHSVQLTLYSLLLEGSGYNAPETEIRQLIKTKTPKVVSHRFGVRTKREHEKFFALVREYLDSLDRGVYNFRPCWSCSMCDYRGVCSV